MDLNSILKVLIVKLIDLIFFVTILSALVLIFFYKKMDSFLKMSLSIEYHTKSDPPLMKSGKSFSQPMMERETCLLYTSPSPRD